MKKVLSFILALALICGLSASAAAASSGGYSYKVLSDGTAEITEYNGFESSVTIPEKLDGHTVSSIGTYAFMFKPVSSVTIRADRITLQENSFFGCMAKTVQIEAKDLVIGKEAFSCCSGIETFSIKADNTTVGKYAFMYASPMKSFRWEPADRDAAGTKTVLEEGAFFASYITDISIPGDELVIGKEAFSCCPNLKTVTADCETVSIGDSAFMFANKLNSFSAPNANSAGKPGTIDDSAFFSCGLSSFVVPGCVTRIGKDAFSCCSKLKSVVIPSTVTSIGSGAFSLCSASPVIKTEKGSAADRYCSSEWGVKCEYISAAEMADIYGEHYAEAAGAAPEDAAEAEDAAPQRETEAGTGDRTAPAPDETDESASEQAEEPAEEPAEQPAAAPAPAQEPVTEIIDLSGYTDDEIVMINRQVDAEIEKRGIVKSAVLQIGKYSVGDDLPAGSYLLEFAPTADKSHYFNYAIYNSAGKEISGEYFCTTQVKITLEEGQTLKIEREPVTISQYKGVFW